MKSQDFRHMLLEEGVTGTDPVRGHEILFNVRCTGDPGRSFQPKTLPAKLIVLHHYGQQEANEAQAHSSHAVAAQLKTISDILDIS